MKFVNYKISLRSFIFFNFLYRWNLSEIVGSSHKNCVLDLLQFDTSRNFIDLHHRASSRRSWNAHFYWIYHGSHLQYLGEGGGVVQTSMQKTIFLYLVLFLKSTEKYLNMVNFSFFKLSTHMRPCRWKNFAFRQVVKKSWWWGNPTLSPISNIISVMCTS